MPPMDTKPLLTPRERSRFTLGNLLRAHAVNDKSELAAFREVSDAYCAASGRMTSGFGSFMLPPESLARDLTPTTAPYLIRVEQDFASALAAETITSKLPLRRLRPVGDVSVGVGTTVATAWVADGSAISHNDPSFGVGALSPKTISAVVNFSHQLWRQIGEGGQGFVEAELARAMAAAIDTAFVQGSGSAGEPAGLLTISGTTSTSGTSIAYSNICDLLAASEAYDASGTAFILGATTAKLLRQRAKASGSEMIFSNGAIDGVKTIVSAACPVDALVVAPFSRVAMAEWDGLEVVVTPLASKTAFGLGQVSVRMMKSVDFLAEKPATVGKGTSIT